MNRSNSQTHVWKYIGGCHAVHGNGTEDDIINSPGMCKCVT